MTGGLDKALRALLTAVAEVRAAGDLHEWPPPDCEDTHRLCHPATPEGGVCPEHSWGAVNRDCRCLSCTELDAIEALKARAA